jgi:hypothetical protein
MTIRANQKQIGGDHYRAHGDDTLQHWDIVRIFDLGYLIGNATKYLFRWRNKNGIEDLRKGIHYIEKQIEELEGVEQEKVDAQIEKFFESKTADFEKAHAVAGQGTVIGEGPFDPHEITWNGRAYRQLGSYTDAEVFAEMRRRDHEAEQAGMCAHAASLGDGEDRSADLEHADQPLAGPLMCKACGMRGGHLPDCPVANGAPLMTATAP